VDISGRPKGLVAWILNVLRIDDETRLQLTATTLSIRRASLQGQNLTVLPLSEVGSTLCGFRKPLGLLAIGLFFAVSGVMSLLGGLLGAAVSRSSFGRSNDAAQSTVWTLVLLIIAALFIVAYFLRKEMVIAVGDNSTSHMTGLTFMPSVIEGVSVDINRVIRATDILNRRMLEAQLNREAAAAKIPTAPPAAEKPRRSPVRSAPRCAGCGATLEADSQFCAECGRAVEP
jgi:hypothetical protein